MGPVGGGGGDGGEDPHPIPAEGVDHLSDPAAVPVGEESADHGEPHGAPERCRRGGEGVTAAHVGEGHGAFGGDDHPHRVGGTGRRREGAGGGLGTGQDAIANALELDTLLPEDRDGTLYLDSDQINGFELGAFKIAATQGITVDGALQVAPAGDITLYGTDVVINADLTARSGSIHLGNALTQITPNGMQSVVLGGNQSVGTVQVAEDVALNAGGLWSNLLLEPDDLPPDTLMREGLDQQRRLVAFSVREPGPAAPDIDVNHYHALLANAADFIVDRVRRAIEEDHRVGGRLALWGRRLMGEALSVVRGLRTPIIMSVTLLRSGRPSMRTRCRPSTTSGFS